MGLIDIIQTPQVIDDGLQVSCPAQEVHITAAIPRPPEIEAAGGKSFPANPLRQCRITAVARFRGTTRWRAVTETDQPVSSFFIRQEKLPDDGNAVDLQNNEIFVHAQSYQGHEKGAEVYEN